MDLQSGSPLMWCLRICRRTYQSGAIPLDMAVQWFGLGREEIVRHVGFARAPIPPSAQSESCCGQLRRRGIYQRIEVIHFQEAVLNMAVRSVFRLFTTTMCWITTSTFFQEDCRSVVLNFGVLDRASDCAGRSWESVLPWYRISTWSHYLISIPGLIPSKLSQDFGVRVVKETNASCVAPI
jgi:hypothetical protein